MSVRSWPWLTRRHFMKNMSLIVAATVLEPGIALPLTVDSPRWLDLVLKLSHFKEIVVIGNAYLRTNRQYADPVSLISALQSGGLSSIFKHAQPEEIERALDYTVREDFAADRIAVVEGWWLSETEARVCALAALMHKPI